MLKRKAAIIALLFCAALCAGAGIAAMAQGTGLSITVTDPSKLEAAVDAGVTQLAPGSLPAPDAGALSLHLARYDIHSGKAASAEKILPQIRMLQNRRYLLEAYVGFTLEAARAGQGNVASARINDAAAIANAVNAVMNKPAAVDAGAEAGDTQTSEGEVQNLLCAAAAKGFAVRGDDANLGHLLQLPGCAAQKNFIRENKLSALVSHHEFVRAYDEALQPDNAARDPATGVYAFEAAFTNAVPRGAVGAEAPLAEDQAYFLEMRKSALGLRIGPADSVKGYVLSELLAFSGQFEKADQVAVAIADPAVKSRALLRLFEHYFLENDGKSTIAVANQMNLAMTAPVPPGTPEGDWYRKPVEAAAILASNPGTLALEAAAMFENPRTRFEALNALYEAFAADPALKIDGCARAAAACVIDAMGATAGHENDDEARDYMYATLVRISRIRGEAKAADEFEMQIRLPKRPLCRGGVCQTMASVFNLTLEKRQSCPADQSADTQALVAALDPFDARGNLSTDVYQKLFCQYATDGWKKYANDPAALGQVRDIYFIQIFTRLMSDQRYADGLLAASAFTKPELRATYVTRLFKGMFSSAAPTEAQENSVLGALYRTPFYSDNTDMWVTIFKALAPGPLETGSRVTDPLRLAQRNARIGFAQRILKEKPEVERMLLARGQNLSAVCTLLTHVAPAPDTGASFDAQDEVFDSCVANLVDMGRYKDAFSVASGFSGGSILLRTQDAILYDRFMHDNENFRHSTLDKDGAAPYADHGFPYLKGASTGG